MIFTFEDIVHAQRTISEAYEHGDLDRLAVTDDGYCHQSRLNREDLFKLSCLAGESNPELARLLLLIVGMVDPDGKVTDEPSDVEMWAITKSERGAYGRGLAYLLKVGGVK
ncbi:hypothetical protein [Singulisphaera sp. PoT]|uniref:hypothetical protein n=1 Tax=Singulisphaera sp. PoT TaxID=3411797 RepID=UPI003BF542C8